MTSRYINWRIKSTQGKGQKLERVERLIFSSRKDLVLPSLWCFGGVRWGSTLG